MSIRDFIEKRPRLKTLVERVELAGILIVVAGKLVVNELNARAHNRRRRHSPHVQVFNINSAEDVEKMVREIRETANKYGKLN